jgi:hypothetical protein
MEIDGKNPIGAGCGDQVRDQLRRDRLAPGRFLLLFGVAVVGDHRGDPGGGGAAKTIDQEKQFHQVVVVRRADRLDDEDVGSTDVLVELDFRLAVLVLAHDRAAQRGFQLLHDGGGEARVRVASKNL